MPFEQLLRFLFYLSWFELSEKLLPQRSIYLDRQCAQNRYTETGIYQVGLWFNHTCRGLTVPEAMHSAPQCL